MALSRREKKMAKVESENTICGFDHFLQLHRKMHKNMVIVSALPLWANVCFKSTVKTLEQSLDLILLLLLLAFNSWLP